MVFSIYFDFLVQAINSRIDATVYDVNRTTQLIFFFIYTIYSKIVESTKYIKKQDANKVFARFFFKFQKSIETFLFVGKEYLVN